MFRGHRLIMCGSNNYLGLTTDPRVRQAAIEAIQRYGTSCTGSRFLNGTLEMHEHLEHQLAEFVGKEAALVFSTGMQVNLGTISALVGRGDYVILDKEDHASIVTPSWLRRGQAVRHQDMEELSGCSRLPEDKGKLWWWTGSTAWRATSRLPGWRCCKKYGAPDGGWHARRLGRRPRHSAPST